MAKVVLAQELPDVLDRIEFRTIGRQMEQTDVVRHLQLVSRLVPAGAVEHQHGMMAIGDVPTDFGQMQVHGIDIDARQDQGRADATVGADRPEQIGPFIAQIARRPRPAAAFGPDIGQGPLLTDAGLILPP